MSRFKVLSTRAVDFVLKTSGRSFLADFWMALGVEIGRIDRSDGFCERLRRSVLEKGDCSSLPGFVNKVTAATFGVSNDRATGGEGFDSGDAERFEAGKKGRRGRFGGRRQARKFRAKG